MTFQIGDRVVMNSVDARDITGTVHALTGGYYGGQPGNISVRRDDEQRGGGVDGTWYVPAKHCKLLVPRKPRTIYDPPPRYGPFKPVAKALPC